jgi:hypothetical protein
MSQVQELPPGVEGIFFRINNSQDRADEAGRILFESLNGGARATRSQVEDAGVAQLMLLKPPKSRCEIRVVEWWPGASWALSFFRATAHCRSQIFTIWMLALDSAAR